MQQIIVYRNPAEAAFWDLLLNSPNMFPIGVGIVVFFVVLLISDNVMRRNRVMRRMANSYASLVIGAVAGVIITWYMWL